MPLVIFQHILDERGKLLIWDGTETTEELRLRYDQSKRDEERPHFKLEKREREFLIGRLLLQLVLPKQRLSVLSNGKPVVDGGWHISFSHSNQLVGLVVAEVPIGLDIQTPDEKLTRIAPRYCSSTELTWLNALDDPLLGATIIWSAKEAVFKVYGQNMEFAQEMQTKILNPEQAQFMVAYNGRHGQYLFEMHHLTIKADHIVFTAKLD